MVLYGICEAQYQHIIIPKSYCYLQYSVPKNSVNSEPNNFMMDNGLYHATYILLPQYRIIRGLDMSQGSEGR